MAGLLVQQVGHAHNSADANPDVSVQLLGVVAGHTLVLCVSTPQSGFLVTGVTDSLGNAWTKVVQEVSGASDTAQVWVAANVAGGDTTLTITMNSSRNTGINLSEWSGLATSFPTPPTGVSDNPSGTSHSSGTATPVSGSYTAIAVLSTNTAATRTADSYTDLANPGAPLSIYLRSAYKTGVSAATSTSWTTGVADTSGGVIVLLQEAAAAPASAGRTRTLTGAGT